MGNTKHTKEQIRERIQQKKLLFDGAFGTYYGGKYDTKQLPELANLEAPERVREIHTEYLEAGAQILRTWQTQIKGEEPIITFTQIRTGEKPAITHCA